MLSRLSKKAAIRAHVFAFRGLSTSSRPEITVSSRKEDFEKYRPSVSSSEVLKNGLNSTYSLVSFLSYINGDLYAGFTFL